MGLGCGGLGPILFCLFALCEKQKPGETAPLLSLNLRQIRYYSNGAQILFSFLCEQASESRSKTGILEAQVPASRMRRSAQSRQQQIETPKPSFSSSSII